MSDQPRRRRVAGGVLNRCKRVIGRNKLLFSTAQYALSFGSFFFPGGTTNYDIIVEGLTSLTNMVGFLNEYTSQRDPDTLNKCSTVLHFSMLLITHVEVLLEKVAGHIGGDVNTALKDATIFYVEAVKAVYRLYLLYIVESQSTMLIQWGRGTGSGLKFTYSLQDYREFLDPSCRPETTLELPVHSPSEPFTLDTWEVDIDDMHTCTRWSDRTRDCVEVVKDDNSPNFYPIRSRREWSKGITVAKDDEYPHDSVEELTQEAVSDSKSVTFNPSYDDTSSRPPSLSESSFSTDSDTSSLRSRSRLRTHSGGSIDPRSLPQPKPAAYVDPRFRSWHWYHHFTIHDKIPGGTKLLRRSQRIIDVGFNSEQLLLLGETLYVIRPAVYSLFLYRCNKKSTERGGHLRQSQRKGNILLALAVSMVLEVLSILCTAKALEMTEQDSAPSDFSSTQGMELGDVPTQFDILRKSKATKNTKQTVAAHPMVEELGRRKAAFFLNLLRSPIMDRTTLPLLKKVVNMLKYLPLVGSLPPKLLDILDYFSSTYFYTSNSS